jgi:hypothetical protein
MWTTRVVEPSVSVVALTVVGDVVASVAKAGVVRRRTGVRAVAPEITA